MIELGSLFSIFTTLFIITLILFHFYVHGRRIGRITDKIPGPRWYPIIGNALDVVVPTENIWHFFRRSGRDFYPVYKLWSGTYPHVYFRHPDDIQILLKSSKHIEKSYVYKFIHPWLQDGLLTSTGEKWKTHRKILTPTFHLHNLREYSSSMIEHTNRLIDALKAESTSEGIIKELHPLLTKFTLNTICESAMGMNITDNDKHQNKYKKAVCDFGNLYYYRLVRPWLKNDFIFSLSEKGKEQNEILKTLHGFSEKIIKERMEYHQETGGKYLQDFSRSHQDTTDDQTTGKAKRRRLAFLDLLIAASKQGLGINAREIQEEVDTFVFEAHDTTATSLVFTILLLAENKEVQTRAREEVVSALERNDGKLTMDAVQKCTYLEQCIKESLRLYPSVPTIGRHVHEDLQLKHAFISKGSAVGISIFDVHRDANFWPRPNVFDPDRFRPENTESRHPFAYIPFSAGPRNCIGQKFAMLELKLVIAGLLSTFYIEPEDVTATIGILPGLMLTPAQPVHAKFVPIMREIKSSIFV